MLGIGQSLISCLLALIFYIGSLLISQGQGDVLDIFTAIFAVMFAGVQTGGNMFFLEKLAAGRLAACNYFEVIQNVGNELEPNTYVVNQRIVSDMQDENGILRLKGDVKLHDVEFKY